MLPWAVVWLRVNGRFEGRGKDDVSWSSWLIPDAAPTKKTFFILLTGFFSTTEKGRQPSYRNMPKRNAKEIRKADTATLAALSLVLRLRGADR